MRKLESETIRTELTDEQKGELMIMVDAKIRRPTSKKIWKTLQEKRGEIVCGNIQFGIPTGKTKEVPLEKKWLPIFQYCNNQALVIEYDRKPESLNIEIIPCTQEQLDTFLEELSEEQRMLWQPFLRIITITQEGKLPISLAKTQTPLVIYASTPYIFHITLAQRLVGTPEERIELEKAMETIIALSAELTAQIPPSASQSHPEVPPPFQIPYSATPDPSAPQEPQ